MVLRPWEQERPQKDMFGDGSPNLRWGVSRDLCGTLSPWVLVEKVAAAPPDLKHCKVQGRRALAESSGSRVKNPRILATRKEGMNCWPSTLAELNPRAQRKPLQPHLPDGAQLGGPVQWESRRHHLSVWDAPT